MVPRSSSITSTRTGSGSINHREDSSFSLSSSGTEPSRRTGAAAPEWPASHFHSYLPRNTHTHTQTYFANVRTQLGFSQQGNYRTTVRLQTSYTTETLIDVKEGRLMALKGYMALNFSDVPPKACVCVSIYPFEGIKLLERLILSKQ